MEVDVDLRRPKTKEENDQDEERTIYIVSTINNISFQGTWSTCSICEVKMYQPSFGSLEGKGGHIKHLYFVFVCVDVILGQRNHTTHIGCRIEYV